MRYKQKTRAGAASADYPTEQLPSSARVWRHPQITRDSTEAEVAAIKRKPDGASKKSSLGSARKGKRVARERFGGKRRASKAVDEEQGEEEEGDGGEEGEEEGYDAGVEGDSEMRRIEESDEELEEERSEQPIASTSAAVFPPPMSRSHQPQSRDLQSYVAPTSSTSTYSVPFTSPYVYGRPTASPMAPPRLPPAPTPFARIQAQESGKLEAPHTSGLFNSVAISSGTSAPSVDTPQMPYPPLSALATAAPAAPGPLARSFENPTLLPPQITETNSFPLLKRRLHTLRPTDPSNSTSANPPQSEIYYYSSSANSNDSQGSVGTRGIGFYNVWVLDTQ